MKTNLIQTEKCSIIYATFEKGETDPYTGKYPNRFYPHTEWFRCPRELDNTDLRNFVNESRVFLGFENDEETENLREVEGKELIAYWRMYHCGSWAGRWFFEKGNPFENEGDVTRYDIRGVDSIIDWFTENYPGGCDFIMREDFEKQFKTWGESENRYLLKPLYNDYLKIMVDTTYGNSDYPVRIYVYKDKEREV